MNVYDDLPLKSIKDDKLDLETYVKALVEYINSIKETSTISIQGGWGKGKTSLINFIKESLESNVTDKHRISCFNFNAWELSKISNDDNLPLILLNCFASKINTNDKESKKLKKIISKILNLYTNNRKEKSYFFGIDVAGAINDLLNDGNDEKDGEIISFRDSFEGAIKEYIDKKKCEKIIIFIDDLDRIRPKYAVDVLEALKLFLDIKNCIFVLAVDYKIILSGISEKYGEERAKELSKTFFDKIIQLPFCVPDGNIKKLINELSHDDKNNEIYKNIVDITFGSNPRSIKRIFNTFELYKKILDLNKDVKFNDTDNIYCLLFYFICVQVYNLRLYNFIIRYLFDSDLNNKNILNKEIEDTIRNKDIECNYDEKQYILLQELLKIIKINEIEDTNSIIEFLYNDSLNNKNEEYSSDLNNFLQVCNSECSRISTTYKKVNIRYRNGSSMRHLPNVFYENKKVMMIFSFVPDSEYKNGRIDMCFWKEKMKDSNIDIYNKLSNIQVNNIKPKCNNASIIYKNISNFKIINNNVNYNEKNIEKLFDTYIGVIEE